MCVRVYVTTDTYCTIWASCAYGSQKTALEPLKLKRQTVVSHHVGKVM